jgi:phage gp45-like
MAFYGTIFMITSTSTTHEEISEMFFSSTSLHNNRDGIRIFQLPPVHTHLLKDLEHLNQYGFLGIIPCVAECLQPVEKCSY